MKNVDDMDYMIELLERYDWWF